MRVIRMLHQNSRGTIGCLRCAVGPVYDAAQSEKSVPFRENAVVLRHY
jgi:hypothetical protein